MQAVPPRQIRSRTAYPLWMLERPTGSAEADQRVADVRESMAEHDYCRHWLRRARRWPLTVVLNDFLDSTGVQMTGPGLTSPGVDAAIDEQTDRLRLLRCVKACYALWWDDPERWDVAVELLAGGWAGSDLELLHVVDGIVAPRRE